MSLLGDHLHIHIHMAPASGDFEQLKTMIMANFQELKEKFNALTTAIAEERAQAQAKLTELQDSINQLTQNVQNGGTEEERTSLLNDINTQITEVKAIIPDAPAPEPEP